MDVECAIVSKECEVKKSFEPHSRKFEGVTTAKDAEADIVFFFPFDNPPDIPVLQVYFNFSPIPLEHTFQSVASCVGFSYLMLGDQCFNFLEK